MNTEYIREIPNKDRIRLLIIAASIVVVLGSVIIVGMTVFPRELAGFTQFEITKQYFMRHLSGLTVTGMLYLGFLGGLFFIPLPLETLYITGLIKGNAPVISMVLLLSGLFTSHLINYFLGARASHIVMNVVSKRQLFKVKRWVNRYGSYAIIGMNILPLPSPTLSFALGIARYNVTRLFFWVVVANTVKYIVIIGGLHVLGLI